MIFHEHELKVISADRYEQWERRIREVADRKAAKRENKAAKRRTSESKNDKEGCTNAPSLSLLVKAD
ncbi:hypothetical protein [Cohnella soli]|uniref:PH domain-containing protein n=1 Tax=Cohnella soli TaxID=425005 RepID=A0ABW0HZJ5_9BACL